VKLRIQFYAQLRDLTGVQIVDVDLPEGVEVSELLEQIYARFPPLRSHDRTILVAAGLEFVDRNCKLKAADEISIMPPVQGG
jgi:MoaD family protein